MFKFLSVLLGAFALFFVSTSTASAAFTISGAPSSVDENGSFRDTSSAITAKQGR